MTNTPMAKGAVAWPKLIPGTLIRRYKRFIADFDAATVRGQKHLMELQRLVAEGFRCAMFFLIQRMDAN